MTVLQKAGDVSSMAAWMQTEAWPVNTAVTVEPFPVWNDLPLITVTESPLTPTRDGSEENHAGKAPLLQLPVAVMLCPLAMMTEPSGWRPVATLQVHVMTLVVTVPVAESLFDGSATALAVTVTLPTLRQERITVFWFVSFTDTTVGSETLQVTAVERLLPAVTVTLAPTFA